MIKGQAPPTGPPISESEDRRTAAKMQVTLSTFVLTAGLSIIAAEAALAAFYLDNHPAARWANGSLLIAALFVIIGFIAGGRGINALSEQGYHGSWDIVAVAGCFNCQAIFTLVAALLVITAVAFGQSSSVRVNAVLRCASDSESYRTPHTLNGIHALEGTSSQWSTSGVYGDDLRRS